MSYTQPLKPYGPTFDRIEGGNAVYAPSPWTMPAVAIVAKPSPDALQNTLNDYLGSPEIHVVSLSPAACKNGIWFSTIVYQERSKKEATE